MSKIMTVMGIPPKCLSWLKTKKELYKTKVIRTCLSRCWEARCMMTSANRVSRGDVAMGTTISPFHSTVFIFIISVHWIGSSFCIKLSCKSLFWLSPVSLVTILLLATGGFQWIKRYVASLRSLGYLSIFKAPEFESSFHRTLNLTGQEFSTKRPARKRCSMSYLVTCGSLVSAK